MRFDRFVMVDWSGGNDTGPTPRADAIWACIAGEAPVYLRNRGVAETWLADLIARERAAGRRLCIGFDFPFGYPQGFAKALTGSQDPLGLWDWLTARIEDAPKANNRFDLAGQINAQWPGSGPFWGNGLKRDIPDLPRTKSDYNNPFSDRRAVEDRAKGAFTVWQLAGAGAVGSQCLMGLPVLNRLRARFAGEVAVWPFEPLDRPVAFVEIWPSLLADAVQARRQDGDIKDAVQVDTVARALRALPADQLDEMLDVAAPEEGWILGVGHEAALMAALAPAPPPLKNDCFALPPGVDWVPMDQALARLAERVTPVVGSETVALDQADGRILVTALHARRASPPAPNSAVDGYGFAGPAPDGVVRMPLSPGRAAAGVPYPGTLTEGQALRILTGAILPQGLDTVILQEDVRADAAEIVFHGPLKRGANTRKAGEDKAYGDLLVPERRRLTPADLALAASTGHDRVVVHRRLRVGVLSNGDEVVAPGDVAPEAMPPGAIYDANQAMLTAQLTRWGHVPVPLGRAPDSLSGLRDILDGAQGQVDAILSSGGVSTGDEDHVSALLKAEGQLETWRIALKPGRPLALGLWRGTPIFGLPGNPVAALVCTLVFARPALRRLAGGDWPEAQGFSMPAAFSKAKKPGRSEYLRARLRDGAVEVFASEGSGRISGLSWAEGLVELGPEARNIAPGDLVRYIPYASFD